MALTEYHDYVFSPNVNMIMDKGVFVGTREFIFCFPSRTEEHEYRKIITTEYSFAGKPMYQALSDIIQMSRSVKELEEQLISMADENDEAVYYKLQDLGRFKVEAHFLGSGIHTNEKDKGYGYKPFVQSLGRDRKKKIKAFYADHPKAAK
jgi:hypothetical protein